jgi:hypothetical protein
LEAIMVRIAVLALHSFLHLSSMTSSPDAKPSFDCSATVQPDELAICNNDDLARKDQLANRAFAAHAQQPDSVETALAINRKFIAARRACGSDVECIRRQQDAVMVALDEIDKVPRSVDADAVAVPTPKLSPLYLGVIAAVLLIVAFGAFVGRKLASNLAASWRFRQARSSADQAARNLRREERRRTRFRNGKLFDSKGRLLATCAICDRSPRGARVRVEQPLERLQTVRFVDEVEKITVEAKVAWQRANEIGLAFRSAADPVETRSAGARVHAKTD